MSSRGAFINHNFLTLTEPYFSKSKIYLSVVTLQFVRNVKMSYVSKYVDMLPTVKYVLKQQFPLPYYCMIYLCFEAAVSSALLLH